MVPNFHYGVSQHDDQHKTATSSTGYTRQSFGLCKPCSSYRYRYIMWQIAPDDRVGIHSRRVRDQTHLRGFLPATGGSLVHLIASVAESSAPWPATSW